MKSETGPLLVTDSVNLPRDRVKVTVVARSLLKPAARKLCRCKGCVFTNTMRVHPETLLHIESIYWSS